MFAVVLLGLLSQTIAFAQNDGFSQTESPSLQAASDSLVNLVQTADKEVADVMIEMAKKTADLYKVFTPLLSQVSINGKTITVNNVDITINKEITQEQLQVIFNKLMQTLKKMEELQLTGVVDFVDLAKRIQEAFTKAITSPFAYADATWAETKSKIIDAFKNANAMVRNSVVVLLDRYHSHLDQLADKLEELVALLPVNGDIWRNIRTKVHNIVEQLRNKIAPAAISNIEAAEKIAELDFTSAIEEMSKDQPIVKRSITDIWSKVKSAVNKLGSAVKDATMKVIEENKPKVIDALQNVKRIVIDAAKQIVIEVNGAIVKVIVGELTSISS